MTADRWAVLCPTVKLITDSRAVQAAEANREMLALPGVRQKSGVWLVPLNAVQKVEGLLEKLQVAVLSVSWDRAPRAEAQSWAQIESKLRAGGEVPPFVLDSFLVDYQKEALVFGWHREGVHFWHPTGSGKTLTGILCGLASPGPLVIVTRAAAKIQYAREVEKFTTLRAFIITPESQLRKKSKTLSQYLGECWEAQRRPVLVVGWESLKLNLDSISALRPGAVVYDESHRGKNSKRWDVVQLPDLPTDAAKAMEQMRKDKADADAKQGFIKDTDEGRRLFVPHESTATSAAMLARVAHKRICTTATPIKDRVRDLYAQLDLAEPGGWGGSTQWMVRYADRKPGTYGGFDTTGSSNIDELNERLTHIAHVLDYRETHRSLPPKRRQSVYIPQEQQCRPSAGFAKQLKDASARGPGAVLEVQLARSASMKRTAVIELIESHVESHQKVVVFTGRKEDCDTLAEAVRKAVGGKGKAQVWSAHGESSTKARQQIIDEYMAHPGPCVLVGTGHSFGESLNLQDTDAALFVMLPYDPGQLRQWEGRFTRRGQKRPVVIYYVIAEGTVDEHVAGILIEKLPAVERVAKDSELAEAGDVLAGFDAVDRDDFARQVLNDLDFG